MPTFVSFFPIVISAVVGFANTEASTLRLCRSLTASEWQIFLMVRFPFALPAIFSGMKIAMTMATIGVIIGEFISAKAGLGYYILYASSRMETDVIFAALFVLCAIGVALFGAVALAEEMMRRSLWKAIEDRRFALCTGGTRSMTSQAENELLTHVGPGTPMGALMRQYWLPACLSSELRPMATRCA